jgi:carboxylate-amine ligase
MVTPPSFSIGIEEEYLVVDRESGDLIREAPPSMLPECEALLEAQVTPEFFQSQIEVGTRVCETFREARAELGRLRETVSAVVEKHGFAIIAASSHPFAKWDMQKQTAKERYAILARDMQAVVRRLMISGMHVHVGIEDEDLRIDLMAQAAYFLPHLLALSTSSPFWEGHNTGLKSYRVAVWNELPRTGLPDEFESYRAFCRHVDTLVKAGVIEDGTKIWWDIRPNANVPTLEMRISDMCTDVDDAICVAALYRCWLRMLYRLRMNNQRWRTYATSLLDENRWRAQRYGTDQGLIDFGRGEVVPFPDLLEEIIAILDEDIEHFDCRGEVERAREILKRGTSADRQVRAFQTARRDGASEAEALKRVVDLLIEETMAGCR